MPFVLEDEGVPVLKRSRSTEELEEHAALQQPTMKMINRSAWNEVRDGDAVLQQDIAPPVQMQSHADGSITNRSASVRPPKVPANIARKYSTSHASGRSGKGKQGAATAFSGASSRSASFTPPDGTGPSDAPLSLAVPQSSGSPPFFSSSAAGPSLSSVPSASRGSSDHLHTPPSCSGVGTSLSVNSFPASSSAAPSIGGHKVDLSSAASSSGPGVPLNVSPSFREPSTSSSSVVSTGVAPLHSVPGSFGGTSVPSSSTVKSLFGPRVPSSSLVAPVVGVPSFSSVSHSFGGHSASSSSGPTVPPSPSLGSADYQRLVSLLPEITPIESVIANLYLAPAHQHDPPYYIVRDPVYDLGRVRKIFEGLKKYCPVCWARGRPFKHPFASCRVGQTEGGRGSDYSNFRNSLNFPRQVCYTCGTPLNLGYFAGVDTSRAIRFHCAKFGGNASCKWIDGGLVAVYVAWNNPAALAALRHKSGTPADFAGENVKEDEYREWIRNGTGIQASTIVIHPVFLVLSTLADLYGVPGMDDE